MSNKVFNLDKALIKIKLTNGNFIDIKLDKNRQIAELIPIEATRDILTIYRGDILTIYRGQPYELCKTELINDLIERGTVFFNN